MTGEARASLTMVEDDKAIAKAVRVSLQAAGYDVSVYETARAAITGIAADSPDLVLLDLGLPDMDGRDLISELRSWSTVPIIVLSARTDVSERIDALDVGADDYLVKPFHMKEVIARVRTALRRRRIDLSSDEVLEIGRLKINLKARSVTLDEQEITLTRKEFAILATLAQHAGHAVTQRQLIAAGWGAAGVDPQYLRIFIAQLRQKLEANPSDPKLIKTEQGVGYRLITR